MIRNNYGHFLNLQREVEEKKRKEEQAEQERMRQFKNWEQNLAKWNTANQISSAIYGRPSAVNPYLAPEDQPNKVKTMSEVQLGNYSLEELKTELKRRDNTKQSTPNPVKPTTYPYSYSAPKYVSEEAEQFHSERKAEKGITVDQTTQLTSIFPDLLKMIEDKMKESLAARHEAIASLYKGNYSYYSTTKKDLEAKVNNLEIDLAKLQFTHFVISRYGEGAKKYGTLESHYSDWMATNPVVDGVVVLK